MKTIVRNHIRVLLLVKCFFLNFISC